MTSMIDRLQGHKVASQTPTSTASPIPKGHTGESALESLRNEVEQHHSAIAKLQNKIDLTNYSFTSQDLSDGWHKIYAYVQGEMKSIDPNVSLNASGTKVLESRFTLDRVKATLGQTTDAQKNLMKAHLVVKHHLRYLQEKIKGHEKAMSILAKKWIPSKHS